MKSNIPPPFLNKLPQFTNSSLFWEKSEPPFFAKISQTQTLPPLKGRGRGDPTEEKFKFKFKM